ncbi:hypothetical protein OS493_007987 [Desmophyllum pertusum]|uniref:Uncharacterized protein n=1 Tax=Desmophyllum pertusum TaxID=174260 RepID=A0A9W9YI88_9CNID|nr:hypothetical protein OS493_007987 [Desmophyllum pertusum]
MGMLTSSYDIAAMILTPLISYIGGSRKKPAFCAWGLFTMGVGFFIFMLPHFVSPPYQAGIITNATLSVRDSGLCAANRTGFGGKGDCKGEAAGGNTLYYALFILGMVVAGAGCTPMYALGIPYMDENVKAKVSPMSRCWIRIGLKISFMFVELGVQTSFTMRDKLWVGNWWLGFAIFGAICVFWSIWLLGFPKEFPMTQKWREKELSQSKAATEVVGLYEKTQSGQ